MSAASLNARLRRLESRYSGPAREALTDRVMDKVLRLEHDAPEELADVLRSFGLTPRPTTAEEK